MVTILTTSVFTLMAVYMLYFSLIQPDLLKGNIRNKKANEVLHLAILLFVGLIGRFIIAANFHGHETDMSCFTAWASMVYHDGIPAFYASDAFTDYPPGYMYILYIVGALNAFLPLSAGGVDALVKSPAIICDILTSFIVYKIARKRMSESSSLVACALFVFNPAVLLNSSFWGQVDSVLTLALLVMVYLVSEKKMIPAYFAFAIAIFIKPQALIFTPIIIFGIVENVFLPKFDKLMFFKNLMFGMSAILLILFLAAPFGLQNVISQYINTLGSYPYATVNAFNIWGAFGQNWSEIHSFTKLAGYFFIVLIVLYSTAVFFKSKNESKYYFAGVILSFGTFMLSSQMHERYAYPSMVMALCAFIVLPDIHLLNTYAFITVSQFINTAWVLFVYTKEPGAYFKSPVVNIFSFINIALTVYMVYMSRKIYVNNQLTEIKTVKKPSITKKAPRPAPKRVFNAITEKEVPTLVFEKTKRLAKLTRYDLIAIAVITALYSAVALYDLGDKIAPETSYEMYNEELIVFDLGKIQSISEIKYFLGPTENRKFTLAYSDNDDTIDEVKEMTMSSVFAWGSEKIDDRARYIYLTCESEGAIVNELTFIDKDGNTIIPKNSDKYKEMFDEQDIVPERTTFRNSTYFDEIYHARTGYEFIHAMNPYEWTHPPLGKVFISWGIKMFGMNPFGWRIAGTIFGIIMVPVIYLFAKKLTKYTWLSIVTCLLFTFDFMHFSQTRIATIDVYVTFFIMLMYYYMYKYYNMSFYDKKFSKTLVPLALSGLFMGLGIASKWTGVYAGCGLAVLFFMTLYKRYREYIHALNNPNGETDGISHAFVIKNFKSYTTKTILFCVGVFVIVPLIIYGLSYIPYLQAEGMQGIKSIIENQSAMLTYHGKTVLDAKHSFESRWYEWAIMKRPIWYYSGKLGDGVYEGINAFGNPAVWWTSIIAFVYMLYLAIVYKDKTALFLDITYLAQLLPWIPVSRLTFIYHYFPSVPFLVLMLGYSIYVLYKNNKRFKYYAFAYTLLAIVLFIMFYPVLSGQPVSGEYVTDYLRWFSSWQLIAG